MPIYEYRCRQCGHTFDAFQRVGADGSDLVCPKCNAAKPEKLFSSFASSGAAPSFSSGISSGCGSGGFS